jgi:hypothetical protein
MHVLAPHDGETTAVTTPDHTQKNPQRTSARAGFVPPFACGVVVATLATFAGSARTMAADTDGILRHAVWIADAWHSLHGFMLSAYDRAPALVLVLGALFVMPMTALLAYSATAMRDRLPAAIGRGRTARPTMTPARTQAVPVTVAAWPATAWLVFEDGRQFDLPAGSGLVRIGRHEDNDLQLIDASVHRHHAIVHGTADARFMITDLSGAHGNGVLINGERLTQAQLRPGDHIVLGGAALTFESAPL